MNFSNKQIHLFRYSKVLILFIFLLLITWLFLFKQSPIDGDANTEKKQRVYSLQKGERKPKNNTLFEKSAKLRGKSTIPGYEDEANERPPATINEDGFLSSKITQLAGLTETEIEATQSIFNKHFLNMKALIHKNILLDKTKSDPNLGIRAFLIKPFEADGQAEYNRFMTSIDSAIGSKKREIILKGYPVTQFFSYGKNEVLIRLYCGDAAGNLLAPNDNKTNITTMERAEVIAYASDSGKVISKSTSSYANLKKSIGDVFPSNSDSN